MYCLPDDWMHSWEQMQNCTLKLHLKKPCKTPRSFCEDYNKMGLEICCLLSPISPMNCKKQCRCYIHNLSQWFSISESISIRQTCIYTYIFFCEKMRIFIQIKHLFFSLSIDYVISYYINQKNRMRFRFTCELMQI